MIKKETEMLKEKIFDLEEKHVYGFDGKKYSYIPDKKALYRTDKDICIGIVGKNYKPVSNKLLLEWFGSITDKAKIKTHLQSYKEVRDGSKTIMSIQYPDLKISAGKKDDLILTSNLINGFDGFTSATLDFGFYRIVCSNGAIIGERDIRIQYRHVGRINEKLVEQFQMYISTNIEKTRKFVKILTSGKFESREEVLSLFESSTKWIGTKYEEYLVSEWKKKRQALSWWIVYNVYTYVITHIMGINAENRLNKYRKLSSYIKRW